ncbi:MAG: cardiolipin synthase [Propionibacteriaceae bacterium]
MSDADMEWTPPSQSFGAAIQHVANTWGRALVIGLAFFAQFSVLILGFTYLADYTRWLVLASYILGVFVVLAILNSKMPLVYKLAWVIPILILPLIGAIFYLLYGARKMPRRTLVRWNTAVERGKHAMSLVSEAELDPDAHPDLRWQVARMRSSSGYLLRDETATSYYRMGEDVFAAWLEAIDKAERYIFLETFILSESWMFEELFAALARKSAQGVDVRVLFDDFGSALRVPHDLKNRCAKAGIAIARVNPFVMWFTLRFNNRDHRKILVVDGTIAFTGGINIADEYINKIERFGTWKDSGIRLEGPGAWSFAVLFLMAWEITRRTTVIYESFIPRQIPRFPGSGQLFPYDDGPFDEVNTAEATYRTMLNRARASIDIFTPYLVLNDEMLSSLCEAAEGGVDVRIVTPGIPDKWYVYAVTRSYYPALLAKGVRIFEYSPGFIHAKSLVVDRHYAVCGSVNFDYRSFYLHQECAVWMHKTACLPDMIDDVEDTIAQCREITLAEATAAPWWKRSLRAIMRAFAPLM